MKRVSMARKIVAVLGILAIFAGTQGFVISSHICNSCGTHEETISFFGSTPEYNHECRDENTASCCSAPAQPEETTDSCCKSEPLVCDAIEAEPCCEFDSERVAVETITLQKTLISGISLQPAITELTIQNTDTGYRMPDAGYFFHNKLGSGRDITRLTCCLLI